MSGAALTLLQLRTRALEEVQDAGAVYFTATKVNEVINDVMGEWCRLTRARRKSTTINVTGGAAIVSFAAVTPTVIDVVRVGLPTGAGGTDDVELDLTTLEEVRDLDRDWATRTGSPTQYMRWGGQTGFQAIRLYPTPTDNYTGVYSSGDVTVFDSLYGGINALTGISDATFDSLYGGIVGLGTTYGALSLDYVGNSTDMTADTETPLSSSDIPDEFHMALWKGVVGRLLSMETALKQVQRAMQYTGEFQAAAAAAQVRVAKSFQTKQAVQTWGENF